MKIRSKTRDAAFQFRMGAAFPGDVNRTHPVTIEPCLIDAAAPPTAYGQVVIVGAGINSVRPLSAADTAVTTGYGVTVRPYPTQAASTTNFGAASFGNAAPPISGILDVCRAGYIMTQIPLGQTCTKNGAVFIWIAASTGVHVQGGTETVASTGNTIALTDCTFNGPPDATGSVELSFNI